MSLRLLPTPIKVGEQVMVVMPWFKGKLTVVGIEPRMGTAGWPFIDAVGVEPDEGAVVWVWQIPHLIDSSPRYPGHWTRVPGVRYTGDS